MTYISPANQVILRNQPHDVELQLSIWQPKEVFRCLVNNSAIAKNARTIAYDTVSLGSYLDVEAGMTLLVGTTAGGSELGRVRIRSIGASSMLVAENSDILWANNLHLTVINQHELWPIYPRMIQDPSDEDTTIWYKDYDITYSNQNSILGTFICMGSNRAGDLRAGPHQEYWSASGTYNVVGSAITEYYWEFEGASPVSGTAHTPGLVTWDTPGDYRVTLKTTAANGGVDTSYRYVKIEQTPSITQWNFEQPPSGSRSDGGSSCTIAVYDVPNDVVIRPQTIVTIYSKERRGNTVSNFNGNVFFTGYVKDGTITQNHDIKKISFELVSIVGLMKEMENFGVSLEYAKTPVDWYQTPFATLRPAIYHYLKYHSTVFSIADYEFVGTDQNIQYFDVARETLYGGLNNLLKNTLFMEIVADRKGKIWSEIMAKAVNNAPTQFPTVMTIQKGDWVDNPNIKVNYTKPLSYLELNGIQFSTTGVSTPLIGCAPGTAPGTEGKAKRQPGLALSSQLQLNQLCGNIYTNENYKLPKVTMSMRGAWTHLDIAPQEAYRMNILPEDNVVGVDVSGSYFAESIAWEYAQEDAYLSPLVTWGIITQNDLVGDTIDVPPAPPEYPWTNPEPSLPPLPEFPPFPEPPSPDNLSLEIVYACTSSNRVLACDNFEDFGNQIWYDVTPETPVTLYSLQTDWVTGKLYAATTTGIYVFPTVYVGGLYYFFKGYEMYSAFSFFVAGNTTNNRIANSTLAGNPRINVNPITGEIFFGLVSSDFSDMATVIGNRTTFPTVRAKITSNTTLMQGMNIGNGVVLHSGRTGASSGLNRSLNDGASWSSITGWGANDLPIVRPDPLGIDGFFLGSGQFHYVPDLTKDIASTRVLKIAALPTSSAVDISGQYWMGGTTTITKSTDRAETWTSTTAITDTVTVDSRWGGYDLDSGVPIFLWGCRDGSASDPGRLGYFLYTNDMGTTFAPVRDIQTYLTAPETINSFAVVLGGFDVI